MIKLLKWCTQEKDSMEFTTVFNQGMLHIGLKRNSKNREAEKVQKACTEGW